jgi:hypothetical protein
MLPWTKAQSNWGCLSARKYKEPVISDYSAWRASMGNITRTMYAMNTSISVNIRDTAKTTNIKLLVYAAHAFRYKVYNPF